MSEASNSTSTLSGGGFLSLLAILFIGLKLGRVIDWPWVWVLSPLWLPWAVFFAVLAVVLLITGGIALAVWWSER